MKKRHLLKTMLLLFALIVGSSSVWATDVDLKLGTNNQSNYSGTINSKINWELAKGSGSNNPYHSNATYSKIYSKNTITISGVSSAITITKIVLKAQSNYIATWTASDKSTVTISGDNATWSGSQNSITLTNSSTAQARINTITITYTETSSPVISANDVNIASDATSGEITYTITNGDESTMTATLTSGDWISNIAVDEDNNKVTFSATQNEGAERTGVITLTYGTATEDVTITQAAYVAKYTVTIETPDNGTLVVKRGDNEIVTGSQIPDGTELTIVPTPAEGYKFKNWQALDASTHTYTANYTYTINAHDVTFKANFEAIPQYTYIWNVNGIIEKSETLYEDAEVNFPEVADLGSKVFYGWVTTSTVDPNEAPTLVNTSGVTAIENTTYYAVFATKTAGDEEEVVDVLTRETTGISNGGGYNSWSGKKATSDAVYAGQSAGNNNSIQLRTDNSNSGIVTTASGGKIKKIVVEWNSNTSNSRVLNIYGKNSAYTDATDLYGTNQGTLLGSIAKSSQTELNVSGNYTYLGLRSNDGAMYLSKITITWTAGTPDTYSDYCTTVAPENVSATIANSGYTTFCSPYDLSFENVAGLEAAYVVTTSTASTATLKKVSAVPAGTGVILKGTTGAVTIPVAEYTGSEISNILVGTLTATHVDTETVYVVSDGKFKLFAGTEIPANKAYLPASALTGGAPSLSFDFGGETTGINSVERGTLSVEGCYTLDGRRVAQPTKGLYIVNGRKVIIK